MKRVRQIMGELTWVPATWKEDAQEATDLRLLIMRGNNQVRSLAVRLRDSSLMAHPRWPRYFSREFTIRSRRDTEMETELSKIQRGFGDLMFYGVMGERPPEIPHYMLLDLHVFRHLDRNKIRLQYTNQANWDGTYFRAYDVLSAPREAGLLIAATFELPAIIDRPRDMKPTVLNIVRDNRPIITEIPDWERKAWQCYGTKCKTEAAP